MRSCAPHDRASGRGRLRVLLGQAEALPVRAGAFQRVTSVHARYFSTDAPAGLGELHRVLVPWGRLALGLQSPALLRWAGFCAGDEQLLGAAAGFGAVRALPSGVGPAALVVGVAAGGPGDESGVESARAAVRSPGKDGHR